MDTVITGALLLVGFVVAYLLFLGLLKILTVIFDVLADLFPH